MMADKMIKLCGLYQNVSQTSGKPYFVGTLSYTSKLLLFPNEQAKDLLCSATNVAIGIP